MTSLRFSIMPVALTVCALVSLAPLRTMLAQDAPSPAVLAAVDRARVLLDSGNGTAARNLLDSLVSAQANTSRDLTEALHWRAVMAESVVDAERDWKRLIVESPLTERASDALVRLAELEALRGNAPTARQYAERVLRDHPYAAVRGKALLLVARGSLAARDVAAACAALEELKGLAPVGELALQSAELQPRCAANNAGGASSTTATDTRTTATDTRTTTAETRTTAGTRTTGSARAATDTASGRFSVQLAAYARRADAEAMVKRLAGMQIEARIDGTVAPFRVRTGRYATRAAATEALAHFTKRGMQGFVAEITP